ncbi:hypothetical protein OUZ56_011547 [Daphnia magna]|uniref:Uncharacterized protein n=1 Tax=Daphnia magna TaxID=35525 RepID=A0ABQ9Z0T2_9CRUS|nr:hypothetical protein OUZ56_011547 [Daphnia magna]
MSIRWARNIPFPGVPLFAFVVTVLSVSFICYLLILESHPKFVEEVELKNLHWSNVRIGFQKKENFLMKDESSSQRFSPGPVLDIDSSELKPMYNLMEEKYGSLWFESQIRDLSLLDCTIGY